MKHARGGVKFLLQLTSFNSNVTFSTRGISEMLLNSRFHFCDFWKTNPFYNPVVCSEVDW
jgi:hypothetical protein